MTVIRIKKCYWALSDPLTVEGAVSVPVARIRCCCGLVCTSLPTGLSMDDGRRLKPYRGGSALGGIESVFVVAFREGTSMDWLIVSMRSGRGAAGLYLHSG